MSAYHWLIDLEERLCSLWSWLSSPLFTIGDLKVAPIALFSFATIGSILVAKLIKVFSPIG